MHEQDTKSTISDCMEWFCIVTDALAINENDIRVAVFRRWQLNENWKHFSINKLLFYFYFRETWSVPYKFFSWYHFLRVICIWPPSLCSKRENIWIKVSPQIGLWILIYLSSWMVTHEILTLSFMYVEDYLLSV